MKIMEDKLSRGNFINKLFGMFELFGNQDNRGLTIAINGRYGSGKTTLLEFIKEKNEENNQFDVIEYNAWEANFFDNPLFPILKAISELKGSKDKIKEKALDIIKKVPHVLLASIASVHGVDLTSLLEKEDFFKEYDEYLQQLDDMKKLLRAACEKKKILFLIDELDRCLPEYQIKVLETVFHVLDIPNLIVVVALDRAQLECSINKMFGNTKNVTGYLTKFIDYEIDLPDDNDVNFYISLLNFHCDNELETKHFIANVFKKLDLGIREVAKITQRINLICREKNEHGNEIKYYSFYCTTVALLMIIKGISPDLFKEYFSKLKRYENGDLILEKTQYGKFLKTVEGKKLGVVFINLDVFAEAKLYLLHFINCFYPISKIEMQSLVNYSGMDPVDIKRGIDKLWSADVEYPASINNIIRRANAVL